MADLLMILMCTKGHYLHYTSIQHCNKISNWNYLTVYDIYGCHVTKYLSNIFPYHSHLCAKQDICLPLKKRVRCGIFLIFFKRNKVYTSYVCLLAVIGLSNLPWFCKTTIPHLKGKNCTQFTNYVQDFW